MVLDKEIKDKLNSAAKNNSSPEDVFATMHQTYLPMALNSLNKLTRKQLIKMWQCTLDIPPDPNVIKRFDKEQLSTFYTLEKLLLSKYAMMLRVIMDKTEEELQVEVSKKETETGIPLTQEQKQEMLQDFLNKKEQAQRESILAGRNDGQQGVIPAEQPQGNVSDGNVNQTGDGTATGT